MNTQGHIAWVGQAWIGPGLGLFLGQAGNNQCHRHMAVQLAIGLQEPVRVVTSDGELCAPAVAIRAGLEHRIEASRLLSIYLDPFCAEARALSLNEPLQSLALGDPGTLLQALQRVDSPAADLRQALNLLLRLPPPVPLDPRLQRLLPLLDDLDCSLQQLAQQAHLSPSRFSHWFKACSGLPLRSYRKWHRLIRALQAVAAGHNLTTAAHAAGFADAAYFSRSFRSLLGLDPSSALERVQLYSRSS
ncbi:helix-turn-helix domain-containing protein [Pseudomonas sp.]|uniref:helix-turn-helix transcriptional regulator n=1 Tax=Pseudomonas sp. TaxID=306 RepID=UPI003BB60157